MTEFKFTIDASMLDDLLEPLTDKNISSMNRSVAKGLENMMKTRIHIEGRDAEQNSLGNILYGKYYAEKKGVARDAVNFRVHGNLQNSWVSHKGPGNSWVIDFNSDKEAKIAAGLSKLRPHVWELSEAEIDYATNKFAEELSKLY